MSNFAKDKLIPEYDGVFRIVFLYVGQGDATLLLIPDGSEYKKVLIDCNLDKEACGLDLIRMLKELCEDDSLDLFINTHPHLDHLKGIKDIYDSVGIESIWHSGHKPSKKHQDSYDNLFKVIYNISPHNVKVMKGSNDLNKVDDEEIKLGDIDYQIFAPAEYVSDEIDGEDPDKRYARIHEQCSVIKFEYAGKSILITGDSDFKAWENHIACYHKENLKADVLSASHHGSRSFFKENEDSEEYIDSMEAINPSYVIISAPEQAKSKHDHPHDDAVEIYLRYVDNNNLFHLGKEKTSVFVDIDSHGNIDIYEDTTLYDEYSFCSKKKSKIEQFSNIGITTTTLDQKPFGK